MTRDGYPPTPIRSYTSAGYKSPSWGAHFEVTVDLEWETRTVFWVPVREGWRPTTAWAKAAAQRCIRRRVRADRREERSWQTMTEPQGADGG